MCGRYFVRDDIETELEEVIVPRLKQRPAGSLSAPSGDIYPSAKALVLEGEGSRLSGTQLEWGFMRRGAKGLLINARLESALERPMFREAFLRRRCVIPASAFYEWDSHKNKVRFYRDDCPVLLLGGFIQDTGQERRFIILTMPPSESVARVHNRMPLVLPPEEAEEWVLDDEAALRTKERIRVGGPEFEAEYVTKESGSQNEQLSLF